MPTTPNRGLPYPSLASANDPPRDLQVLAEAVDAQLTALDTANPVSPLMSAGWGVAGSFQGALATRAAGGLVGLSGMVWRTGTTIPATTVGQTVANLPEGYRPPAEIRVLTLGQYASGSFEQALISVKPNGNVDFGWLTARAWTLGQAYLSIAGVSFVAAT